MRPPFATAATLVPAPSAAVPFLESAIGEIVAMTSYAIGQALDERNNDGVCAKTSRQGSDLLVQLYALRLVCIDEGLDFDRIAREFGKRAIACHWSQLKHEPDRPDIELTNAMLDELTAWPLALLGKVIRAQMY